MVAAAVPAGAQPAWAHQAPGFQSNGAISVKSLSGGAYGGTENPAGAIVRANQSAVTQPPTVIIQATSSQQELRTFVRTGANIYPACPAGFTAVFQYSVADCSNTGIIFFAGGTNLIFGQSNNAGTPYVGFSLSGGVPWGGSGGIQGASLASAPTNMTLQCAAGPISAEICAK